MFKEGQIFQLPMTYLMISKAKADQEIEERKLGGWLTTAAADLQGQQMIAAIMKGALDLSWYNAPNLCRWNDNHGKPPAPY